MYIQIIKSDIAIIEMKDFISATKSVICREMAYNVKSNLSCHNDLPVKNENI